MSKHKKNTQQTAPILQNSISSTNASNNLIHVTIPQMIMSVQEYQNLTQENIRLKQRVAELEHDELLMKQHISDKNREIDELKHENELLRLRIQDLETIAKDQAKKITEQSEKIKLLEQRMNNQDDKELINKLSIALQDLNTFDKLENKLGQHNYGIRKLHENRNSECHFIRENDNDDIKNYKKILILKKLTNMSDVLINKFDKKYGKGFIRKIISYIEMQNIVSSLSEQEQEEINEWFE